MNTFFIETVNNGFHSYVTCQIPIYLFSLSFCVQMTKQTVEHHMKIHSVYINSALAVQFAESLWLIVNHVSVRSCAKNRSIGCKAKAA